jgi:enolase-phosphatase E1
MKTFSNIHYVLLDIEGTTCPVSFVSEVLFPYARQQLLPYLKQHQDEEVSRSLLAEIHTAWQNDPHPEARALARGLDRQENPEESQRQSSANSDVEPRLPPRLCSEAGSSAPSLSRSAMAGWLHVASGSGGQDQANRLADLSQPENLRPEDACIYLDWLIRQDRKLTALKELQGLIWDEGYRQGRLIAPLFADVPDALRRWQQKGLRLAVYSSGSIQAQKLLYTYTTSGNLRPLFSHWFDTRTGPKNQHTSYLTIADTLQVKSEHILFISDAPAELVAAKRAQMTVIFSQRPENPQHDAEGFAAIENFDELDFLHA